MKSTISGCDYAASAGAVAGLEMSSCADAGATCFAVGPSIQLNRGVLSKMK
jgi:hypothetical protein